MLGRIEKQDNNSLGAFEAGPVTVAAVHAGFVRPPHCYLLRLRAQYERRSTEYPSRHSLLPNEQGAAVPATTCAHSSHLIPLGGGIELVGRTELQSDLHRYYFDGPSNVFTREVLSENGDMRALPTIASLLVGHITVMVRLTSRERGIAEF